MGRIRTLKPEFHAHEELSALPAETHLLAAALLNYADDEGYFNANPVLLKAGTTPLRSDKTRLDEQVLQLETMGYIEVRHEGIKCVGRVVRFDEHQRVSHPAPSKLKSKFEALPKSSRETPEKLRPEGNGTGNGTGNREGAPAPFAIPDWVDQKSLDRFIAMRKKIRKPVADEALPLLVLKLEGLRRAGNDPTAVLDQSTMNSWQGLFELRGDGEARQKQATVGMNPQPQMSDEDALAIRKALEAKGRKF